MAPIQTQDVQVDRYSSANIQELSLASLSETMVCFDENNDDSCLDEGTKQILDSGTGTVTLEWRSIDLKNTNIIAQNSDFLYRIKASEIDKNDYTKLFINPVTDAATRLGKDKLKEIIGYDGDLEDLSPKIELQENLVILSDCIAKLTESQTIPNKIYDKTKVKEALEGLYSKIEAQVEKGHNPTQIVVNVMMGQEESGATLKPDNTPVIADFSIEVSENGVVKFSDLSKDADGDELVYKWTFGDGAFSTEKAPTHKYITNGTYKVHLLVSDGNSADTKEEELVISNITIEDIVFEPSFEIALNDLDISITNTSTVKGTDVSYLWDFGDGTTSTETSPSHTYVAEGLYQIKLEIKTQVGQSKTVSKQIKIELLKPEIEAIYTNVDGYSVSFESGVTYAGTGKLTYLWDFGDGETSTLEKPTHKYQQEGSYQVTLKVSDGVFEDAYTSSLEIQSIGDNSDDSICPKDDPYCKGFIDLEECKQNCESHEVEICPPPGYDDGSRQPIPTSRESINNQYYATNPNNQFGANKTITSMSDWTSDMIVAQGAANDDPRAFRGNHELPRDLYALYAAYDDNNLYLMVEMPNLDGDEVGSYADYTSDTSTMMGIGLRTGQRIYGDGHLSDGNNVWLGKSLYSIEQGIDTLLMFHPNFIEGKGFIYKTNSDGKFINEINEEGLVVSFEDAGITRVVEHVAKSANYWGLPNNIGKQSSFYLEPGYEDLLAKNSKASGRLYQLTIPLSSINVTKDDLDYRSVSAMVFSTMGMSIMDALPWTPNLVDNANLPFTYDDLTSHEKEDFDFYDVPLAKIKGGKSKPCVTEIVTNCSSDEATQMCLQEGTIDLQLNHSELENDTEVVSTVSVETGYKDVTYEWEVTEHDKLTTSYNETTKEFVFIKGDVAKNVTVTVTAKNLAGKKTGQKTFDITIPAVEKQDVTTSTIEAGFTATYSTLNVTFIEFESNVKYNGTDKLHYLWDFGDGNTSDIENPTHQYEKPGTYQVVLKVTDGVVEDEYSIPLILEDGNNTPVICPTEDPFCMGNVEPEICKSECKITTETYCTGDLSLTIKVNKLDNPLRHSIDNGYYKTNPNKPDSLEKTILSMSDWTSDMIIAQGAANDDPKAFRGNHELPRDLYALYAAYDEDNLYLMVEIPNLDGSEIGGFYDYTADKSIYMGIGIRTGARELGTGLMEDDNSVWLQNSFYSIEEGIDTLLVFTPNFTEGKGELFKTNAQGRFTYDDNGEGYRISFEEAGIKRVVEHTSKSKNYWGFSDNKDKTSEFYLDDVYEDLLVKNSNASGHLYQLTIPLKSLDISKEHIKNFGIAVMAFSTMGASMMDALPWTPNLVDNANLPYTYDDLTSHEKEDFDVYDVPLAVIAANPELCRDFEIPQCATPEVESLCISRQSFDFQLSHQEEITDTQVITKVEIESGFNDVVYEWQVTGQDTFVTPFDETNKELVFVKGENPRKVTITVTLKSPSEIIKYPKSFDLIIPACEKESCLSEAIDIEK
jgi:PKD repeat protein